MLTGSIFAPESILQIYADENFYCGIIFAARILLCSSAARIKSGNVDENTRARKKERKKGGGRHTLSGHRDLRQTFREVLIA